MNRVRIVKRVTALIAAMVITIGAVPTMNIKNVYANAPSGIKNNGLDGIYIDINASPYTDYANIRTWGQYAYTSAGCAWFASARVRQLTGKGTTIWSGKSWWNGGAGQCGFSTGREPRAKALACYEGHVTVVEAVNGNTITVSEGGRQDIAATYGYCTIERMTRSRLEGARNGRFLGYVYLGGSSTPAPSQANVWWSGEQVRQNVTEGSVDLGERLRASARGHWTEPGVAWHRVGHPEEYQEFVESSFSYDGTYINVQDDLIKDAHANLYPGIDYQYVLFAKFNGTRYTSSIRYFKMAGTHTHSWDAGKIVIQPTGQSSGLKTYTCTICGVTKDEYMDSICYTVTYDPNGGDMGNASKQSKYYNNIIFSLPEPTKKGYAFDGWYTKDGQKIESGDRITSDITIKAKWIAKVTNYTVTFDANGGYCSATTKQYQNNKIDYLPTPTRSDYTFEGWYTKDGQRAYVGNNVGSDLTLIAKWTAKSTDYTVTFDANGGTVSTTTKQYQNNKIDYLPTPTRSDYTFEGWYTKGGQRAYVGNNVGSDLTLIAKWTAKSTDYTVTFDANGGTVSTTTKQYQNNKIDYLPTPTRSGYTFKGWYTKSGQKAGIGSTFSGNITLIAKWEQNSTAQEKYTVTFDANGGAVNTKSEQYRGRISWLPNAFRDGYTFDGWYTDYGTKVNEGDTISSDLTLVAHWTENATEENQKISKVTGIKMKRTGKKKVKISWKGNNEDTVYYELIIKKGKNSMRKTVWSGNKTTITVKGTKKLTVKIRACDLYERKTPSSWAKKTKWI